jgi:P27 family predicted phage terminase small subunit
MNPKVPTHWKLLRGNPGKRPINGREPQPTRPAEPPAPPDLLSGLAAEEWRRVAPKLFYLRCFTNLDLMPLAAYCESYARWRHAIDALATAAEGDEASHGLTVQTGKGNVVTNPLVWISAGAARDMLKFAAEFGLSPVARSRINAVNAIGDGKFAGLLAGYDDGPNSPLTKSGTADSLRL